MKITEEIILKNNVSTYPILNWTKIRHKAKNITENQYKCNLHISGYPQNLLNTIQRLAKTCYKEKGIGLAAPQVGIYKNIIICKNLYEPIYNVYINPTIEPIINFGETVDVEHCLSVPDKGFDIKRWNKINLTWQEYNSEEKMITLNKQFEGFEARVIQHEYDHLSNVSIPQRWKLQNK